MDNMRIYNAFRKPPQEALKSFSNGRFSGTDISPMWRIQALTELYGPAGEGWYTEVVNREFVPGAQDTVAAFMDINLYVRTGAQEWSKPIFGTGGNMFVALEKGALRTSDEAMKMAYTDALSVACKALGIGADVYWSNGSKYERFYNNGSPGEEPDEPAQSADRHPTKDQLEKLYLVAASRGFSETSVRKGILKRYNKLPESMDEDEYQAVLAGYLALAEEQEAA